MAGTSPTTLPHKLSMRFRDHLDYLPLNTGGPVGFYSPIRPPCNEAITGAAYVIAILASAAGSYVSYQSAQTQAKQTEYNAEAQRKAIGLEQQRQAAQQAENERRAVQEQRRQRAAQLNALASSGAMLGTGTPLAIEADTWAKQQTELADSQRVADLSQRQLAYEGYSAGIMGKTDAAAIRRNATGQAISNLGSIVGMGATAFSTRPRTTYP